MERYLKNSNYSILMNKRDLEKLSNAKPKRPNRPPPPIPEGVKPFKPKQTVKLRIKQKVVDDRPGWVRNQKNKSMG